MTKTLTKSGNSYAMVIDRPIMDLLNIQPDTPLEITTEGGRIILTPIHTPPDKKQKVREAAAWVNKNYSKALKKLAEQEMTPPIFLDLDEVLEFHAGQLALYGGQEGIRDQGLLESALAQPCAMMFGNYLHEDLPEMAAAYLFHIAENQPFTDGNKRTALMAAITFLKVNGFVLAVDQMDVAELVLKIGRREQTKADAATYFRENLRPAQ